MPINFTKDEFEDVIYPHEDPLVINQVIGQNKIWKVLVDGGSSVNILFHRTYIKMNLNGKQLEPCHKAPYLVSGKIPFKLKVPSLYP